jgi:hypothetical protein
VLALRVLAVSKTRTALDYLLGLTMKKRRFWGHGLAAKSTDMLAALGGLAQHWSQDGKVKSVVALAARSGDAEIRAVVAEKKR